MKLSPRYGSHLPVLLQALGKTTGPVLELGMGVTSTPLLSAWCELEQRGLWSLDNDAAVVEWGRQRRTWIAHTIWHVDDWDGETLGVIDRVNFDVALVDHSPSERRVVEIARLAHRAQYIVIHDSNGRYEREYHYQTIYPLFRYKLDFTALEPSTTVLSNFHPLDDFWSRNWKSRSITF